MANALTPETLVYGLCAAGDPQISPDGRHIVYTLAVTDRETRRATTQLWLCAVDGSGPRRLTWSGERNRGARWSPDGRAIAFVSDRGGSSGLYVLPMAEPGEAREITHHIRDIGDLAWSPDGQRIAYVIQVDPATPDEAAPAPGSAPKVRVTRRIDYKQDGYGYLGDLRRQVWVVEVESGRRRQVTYAAGDHNGPQWSPDGRWLAMGVPNRNGMCSQLGVTEVESAETHLIGPEMGVVATWSWSPTGEQILYAGDTAQTWQTDWFVYSMADHAVRRLTTDLQCLPDSGFALFLPPAQPIWLDAHRVLFHAFRAGSSGLYTLDVASGQVEMVESWQALHAGVSADAACRYVVQAHASLEAVGEITVYDRTTGVAGPITALNAAVLRDAPPARWERLDVQRAGLTVEAWLLLPPDFDPAKRYPLVLDVHGGPNSYYGYGFNAVQQCLATHGFLVVYCNPRGSGSYGRDFTQRVTQDWGGEDYLDLMAVVDAVLVRPYADAERTGIYGYSYGGYMTSWVIGQTQRFKAAVCGAPVFDLESFYGTSDIGHIFGDQQFGGPPHARREWFAAHSPSTFAHRATTPTLIVHGEADERCPIGQGEQMFVALCKAGCEVEFARYPGQFHGLMRGGPPEHRADYLARVLAWFQGHLGGPA